MVWHRDNCSNQQIWNVDQTLTNYWDLYYDYCTLSDSLVKKDGKQTPNSRYIFFVWPHLAVLVGCVSIVVVSTLMLIETILNIYTTF